MLDRTRGSNPTSYPRLSPAELRAGSHYYLVVHRDAELRFDQPHPDRTRVDIFELGGEVIEEARTICYTGRHGQTIRPVPPGRGWRVHDASHSSFTIWQRKPPWGAAQENPP
jgi:hypothetical protein